ncbi:hypothetical protein M595_2508 [Lyngbya aestuarii BL J]|uniref:Uncharacterized protein n=1 Tax=Lyngbya aestuarii BL J TaxID=1348334 RepID=U7QKB0_9CYAN|nr:hypothetical protein M595_2508 [Lyngbya aestuarii BL J]
MTLSRITDNEIIPQLLLILTDVECLLSVFIDDLVNFLKLK